MKVGIKELISVSAMTIAGLSTTTLIAIGIALTIIEGLAIWKAMRLKETGWFSSIIIINMVGIPSLIYL